MSVLSWKSLFVAILAVCALSSCASDETAAKKKKLYNPGDELNSRPWGQGNRAQHYATPFGLPLSQ